MVSDSCSRAGLRSRASCTGTSSLVDPSAPMLLVRLTVRGGVLIPTPLVSTSTTHLASICAPSHSLMTTDAS